MPRKAVEVARLQQLLPQAWPRSLQWCGAASGGRAPDGYRLSARVSTSGCFKRVS